MAGQLKEIDAIANDPKPPTFENTIVALERSGRLLDRSTTIFFNLVGADTNDARNQLRQDYAAKFSAHDDAINLNPKLFARIATLYDKRTSLKLDAEQLRLVERYYKDFVRAGAKLSESDKTRLKQMNSELAELSTQFSQNVLDEVNAAAVTVDDVKELDGLTPAQIAAAADEAKSRGLEGKYVLTLLNTTGQPPGIGAEEPRASSAPARGFGRAWQPRWQVRQSRHREPHDETTRRAREAARLPHVRRVQPGEPDGRDARSGEQDAGSARARSRRECEARSGGPASSDRQGRRQLQARAVGLGVLHREGARRSSRSTNRSSSPISS